MKNDPSECEELVNRQVQLFEEARDVNSPLSLFALQDSLIVLYDECTRLETSPVIEAFLEKYEPIVNKLRDLRISMNDFKIVKLLGRGAFGEVNLAQCKMDNQYYAIKKLNKVEVLSRQEAFYMEERELLGRVPGNWVTSLQFSFQDSEYLYIVMEYLAGGNMLNLMITDAEIFTEENCRFYIAETILGVQEIHDQGFVYRDLKPENMLFDRNGHVKLADFGSCYKLNDEGFVDSQVAAGTPYYIAPEVLQNNDGKQSTCGKESDWWSVGIVLYEMLCGDPPFFSEKNLISETYGLIMNWKESFKFPDDIELTDNAKDLLKKLICDQRSRLTFSEIKAHPFFKEINWNNLHQSNPPFVPELKGPSDTTYFDDEEIPPATKVRPPKKKKGFTGDDIPFIGYTFTRSLEQDKAFKSIGSTINRVRTPSVENVDKLKKEAEEWQQKYLAEKNHAQSEQQLFESQIAEALQKYKLKETQLEQEGKKRKETEASKLELEKAKSELEVELDELKRKFEKFQGEKDRDNQRISSLEEQLEAAFHKISTSDRHRRSSEADTVKIKQFQELKNQFERQAEELSNALQGHDQLKEKASLLELQTQRLKDALDSEKQGKKQLQDNFNQLQTQNEEFRTEKETSSKKIEKLTQEQSKLQEEIQNLKNDLSTSTSTISKLESEKQKLEREKVSIQVELQDLNREKKLSEERESDYKLKLDNLDKHTRKASQDGADIKSLNVIRDLEERLTEESSKREKLREKNVSLTGEVNQLQSELEHLKAQLETEKQNHQATQQKLQSFQERLKEMDEQVLALKNEIDALNNEKEKLKNQIKTLTTQQQNEEEKSTKLGETISELQRSQDELNVKIMDLTTKYNEEKEKSKSLEKSLLVLQEEHDHDSNGIHEEIQMIQDATAREVQSLKDKLETEIKHSQELDDLISKTKKEQKLAEVDKTRFEKELIAEKQNKQELEEELENIKAAFDKAKINSHDLTQELEKLKEETQKSEKKLKKEKKEKKDMEIQLKESKEQLQKVTTELETTKSTVKLAENPKTPRSDQKEKLEIRRLRDECVTLQMRLQNEESLKMTLEEDLNQQKQSNSALVAELENLKKMIERYTSDTGSLESNHNLGYYSATSTINVNQSSNSSMTISNSSNGNHNVGVFASLRRNFSKRRPKLDSLAISPIDPQYLEGYLRVPKEKVRHGWTKKYFVVRDLTILCFDKEKDKEKSSEGKIIVDLRTSIFLCRELPENTILSKEDPALAFIIQARSTLVHSDSTNSMDPPTEIAYSQSQLEAKIRATEKEIEIEEKILINAEKLLSVSKSQKRGAQLQIDGSKKKLEQLRLHLAKLKAQSEELGNNRSKRIQNTHDYINSEEKYKASLIDLLAHEDNEEEKKKITEQIEECERRLAEAKIQLENHKAPESDKLLTEELQYHEFNGHRFKTNVFEVDTYCQYCAKLLVNRQGFLCPTCGFIVHTGCHTLGGPSCTETISLKDVTPLYFLAADREEKQKWIEGINALRESFLRNDKRSSGDSSPVTPSHA